MRDDDDHDDCEGQPSRVQRDWQMLAANDHTLEPEFA